MTHGLGPGKPGPRAAKPITPPYVENNYRIEVKITCMLIAYLVLLCEFFWEFSTFHFCRSLVDIYWHPLLRPIWRLPNMFFGTAIFLIWRGVGIRDFKAKSGLKECLGDGMPKITLRITGLHEILGPDYGIEEPYWGPFVWKCCS